MADSRLLRQFELVTPPTAPGHLARLKDVIDYVARKVKNPVRVVETANIVGTYESTDKTITQTTAAEFVIDGITLALGDRVLVAGQTDKTQNGIYVVTTLGVTSGAAGVLTRSEDFDENADIVSNVRVPVSEGDDNKDSTWVLTTDGTITLDSSNLVFAKDSAGAFAHIVQQVFTLVGDDSTSEFTFSHNWDTLDVTHELYDSDGVTVFAQFTRTSVNDVKVTLGQPLATGDDLKLVVRGWVEPV
jgi:hypothetical protein